MHSYPLLVVLAALAGPPRDTVPLYTDLGDHHVPITTRVPLTQRYFDQGMRLLYGFNHGEAIRSFNHAAQLDPNCAMCYWGVAYAYGPHVNAGMDSAAGIAAYTALRQALSRVSHASPRERAYIAALEHRYVSSPPADRAALDSAYAASMAEVVRRYPRDLDAATLYAEALMDKRPWNYWDKKTGEPYPGTSEIMAQLERVLRVDPRHPGACHYYIHAVEAVAPEKAVACAERLAGLMPGAGHLVHMPAHIYIRVGRYADAITANQHAVHADEAFIEGQKPQGLYPLAYYPHNHHFLAFAATLAGKSALAIEAAKRTAATTPVDVAKRVPFLEPYLYYPYLTLVTFGRWDELLAMPLPPADLAYSRAMAQYARGVALAATHRFAAAQAALDTLTQIARSGTQAYSAAGWTTPSTNLQIATHALLGEIAARRGALQEGIAHFRGAMKIEDDQLYTEPPDWYYPIRHSLAAALLQAGGAPEAERLYREDLKRFPENGWSLFGLAQALRAQGKHVEAAEVDARLARAWAGADVTLTASRF